MLLPIVLAMLGAAAADDFPRELLGMRDVLSKEKELVDGARLFDRQQKALMAWDDALIEAYQRADESALAENQAATKNRRAALIQRVYDEAMKLYPENARLLNYKGECAYDLQGQQAEALKLWKLAAALDSTLAEPLNNLAIFYCEVGDYDQGLQYLDRAVELDPDNPDMLYNLAQMYLIHFPQFEQRKKWSRERVYREAMKLSKRSAELAPESFQLHWDYAFNFFSADAVFKVPVNWKDAAAAWQRTRDLARSDHEIFNTWMNEGRVWLKLSDTEKAAACIHEALKILPNNEAALNLLQQATAPAK
ncbi:MAG: tetratricopeptide repeat protein [Candidatus Hydrogenedentes bacterium]|nr:tetratricopeptide repeat protein [Candidatus Hydrogenedentota bacterium]